MLVYRITLEAWTNSLTASGRAARWNSNGKFMAYTASTRALACLENLAHRKSMGSGEFFKVTVINIPDHLKIDTIEKNNLLSDWQQYINYSYCQALGDHWLVTGPNAILRVPSAIIAEEFNYLINPAHSDFKSIIIQEVEDFRFDERLIPPR